MYAIRVVCCLKAGPCSIRGSFVGEIELALHYVIYVFETRNEEREGDLDCLSLSVYAVRHKRKEEKEKKGSQILRGD